VPEHGERRGRAGGVGEDDEAGHGAPPVGRDLVRRDAEVGEHLAEEAMQRDAHAGLQRVCVHADAPYSLQRSSRAPWVWKDDTNRSATDHESVTPPPSSSVSLPSISMMESPRRGEESSRGCGPSSFIKKRKGEEPPMM